MSKKVKIYSTPSCSFCHRAKDYLKANNIDFEDVDVSLDTQKAEEMVKASGQMGVPVIDIDGQLIVGFDKEKIKALLGI
tara:strand:- start:946 stop:1182 length:237 start_codon:yes stop_codon:yes gene_type:complete